MTSTIEFRQIIQTQLRGGILVDCTKSQGLHNQLVAKHLIEQLKMKPIVVLDCDDFPSTVKVTEGKPSFPAQIYSSINSKISLAASDFVIPRTHEKQLARGLIAWAKKQSIGLIISFGCMRQFTERGRESEEITTDISAAYSTESARQRIAQSGIEFIEDGSITGLAGALLSEGLWNNVDVLALQIKTESSTNRQIVERTIQAIDIVLPEVKFDISMIETRDKIEVDLNGDPANIGK
jgi:predicted ATP-grasp superfamily ATP-dependent carboligase